MNNQEGKKLKTNWKYLFVIIFVALFSGVGILYYVYLKDILQPLPSPTPIFTPKRKKITLELINQYSLVTPGVQVGVSSGVYIRDFRVQKQASSGNYIYLAMDNGILEIIDVSDPNNPKIVTLLPQFLFLKETDAIFIKDNYLYVSGTDIDDEAWMKVLNISDPTDLNGVWHQEEFIKQIAISDNYLFLLGSKFMIYDISDPEKPVLLFTRETNDIGTEAMCVSGNYVYLGGMFKGISVMDVSNKGKPVLVGKYEGATENLLCIGNIIYQMGGSSMKSSKDRFIVLDATNPLDIKMLKSFQKEELEDFYQIDNNLFITYKGGILIFDISNPADPSLLKDVLGDFGLISGQGKYLYSIIDNPSNFRQSLLKIYEIKYE
jgi:hypothetical protein